ncbi:MAG: type II secretion system inner membrane protein GspF, partial [Comamonas sp.]
MAGYRYEALDAQGHTQKGTLDADSTKSARAQLRMQGLVPLAVQELGRSATNRKTSWMLLQPRPALPKSELTVWTRQLASLVQAGLTIERALQSLCDESLQPALVGLMADLLSQVKAGSSFSQALTQHPTEFDNVYCAVVHAGERSGSLALVLSSLADDLEAAQLLKSKIIGAALYPMIVSAIAILIVMFLMVYVLPQVADTFSNSKRSLPVLTTVMLWISALLSRWWWLMLAVLVVAAGGTRLALLQSAQRLRWHAWLTQMPVLGKLLRNYNGARFASTLGMLTSAGVPILQALKAASQTVGNQAMKQDLEDITRMVREGAPLGLALAQKPRFPKLVSTFARLGGETGNLGPMLLRVGKQLSDQVQRTAMQLASVLEPVLILAMGIIVLMIVLSVLMPIIELNSFV